jgi:trans-aconitate 2-methyltransferase
MSTRDWDAAAYDRIANPQTRWGTSILDRLPLSGDERVLDAGCGSGRVTQLLLERLPRGSVVALDASADMLAVARDRLSADAARVEFVLADLSRPLPIESPVDAVLSTATFHWISDHAALYANLAAVLRPGGWLVAQSGGAGNLATVMAALDDLGEDFRPWHFATAEDTRRRLQAAGFVDVETWLHVEPTPIPAEDFETFLGSIVLVRNVERLPPPERAAFVRAVAERLPGALLDYVRLNLVARRGPSDETAAAD